MQKSSDSLMIGKRIRKMGLMGDRWANRGYCEPTESVQRDVPLREPKFKRGDEVFVRAPGRYLAGARAIIGKIERIIRMGSSYKYEFMSERIAVNTGPGQLDFKWYKPRVVSIHEIDLDLRRGTLLSELDGRDGDNEAWRRLSESWGYP